MAQIVDETEYRPDEAADLLNISVQYLRIVMREGHLAYREYGPRTRRITGAELRRYRDNKVRKAS